MDPLTTVVHVGVVLGLSGPITSPQMSTLKAEVEALWTAYNVHITWFERDDDCASASHASSNLPVDLLLQIAIESDAATPGKPAGFPPLGFVRFNGGTPVLTVHIRYAAVQRFVFEARIGQWGVQTLPVPLRDQLMGRALGRVLAHELGHVLLTTPAHTGDGLMRPVFGPGELLRVGREHLRLSRWAEKRLRASHVGISTASLAEHR